MRLVPILLLIFGLAATEVIGVDKYPDSSNFVNTPKQEFVWQYEAAGNVDERSVEAQSRGKIEQIAKSYKDSGIHILEQKCDPARKVGPNVGNPHFYEVKCWIYMI